MSDENGLPTGWAKCSIEEVAKTQTGGTPSRGREEYFGGSIPWVKSGELRDKYVYETEETITQLGMQSSSAKLFPKGTICIALYGATIGKLGLLQIESATNQAVCGIFLPPEIDTKYLFYFLMMFRSALIEQGKGGAQSNISNKIVRQTCFPVAPYAEQIRIVAKIEELLSDLDAGVSALRRAQANLKRYRAAVLRAAVTGELTAAWRAAQPNIEPAHKLLDHILSERRRKPKKKCPESVMPEASELPDSWCWARVEHLGAVQLGRQRSPKNRSNKYPTKYIRAANITENGLAVTDLLDMEFTPAEQEIYRLHSGDIILSEASGSPDQVGKPAIWNDEVPNRCFQNTIIRLRPDGVSNRYLLVVFRHFYINKIFARTAAGVGINHLSAAKFAALSVPLPPLREQELIVSEVEQRLSLIAATENYLAASLKRAARLRQSILKEAFAGWLVAQDADDEAASVLLQRIRAERQATIIDKAKPSRKRRGVKRPRQEKE